MVQIRVELHRLQRLRRVHKAGEGATVCAAQLPARRRDPILKAARPGARKLHAPKVSFAIAIGVFGQRLGRFQEVVPRPTLSRIGQLVLVKDLLVKVDSEGREIFGQQVLFAFPLTWREYSRQVDARVKRVGSASDERRKVNKSPLTHKPGHCIIANLENVGRVARGDLGQNAGVIITASDWLELNLNVGIRLLKQFDNFEMGRETLAAIAGANTQHNLGPRRARRRGWHHDDRALHHDGAFDGCGRRRACCAATRRKERREGGEEEAERRVPTKLSLHRAVSDVVQACTNLV